MFGEAKGLDHADGYAFAMQETAAVACCLFKGVAKGVAEVEEGAYTLLRLVFGNDGGLGAAAPVNGEGARLGVAAQQDFGIGLQPFEK